MNRFGERFRDGQHIFASFLFAVLLLTVPPCPMESAPLIFSQESSETVTHASTSSDVPSAWCIFCKKSRKKLWVLKSPL